MSTRRRFGMPSVSLATSAVPLCSPLVKHPLRRSDELELGSRGLCAENVYRYRKSGVEQEQSLVLTDSCDLWWKTSVVV